MVGASFSSAGPSQNRSKNGFERRWLKKSMKTASGTILGSAVFIPARFSIAFGAPLGPQNCRFWPTFWRRSRLFGQFSGHLWFFFARRCLEKVLGPIWNVLGTLPGKILEGFWTILCVASIAHAVQGLSQLRPKVHANFRRVSVPPAMPRPGLPGLQMQRQRSHTAL